MFVSKDEDKYPSRQILASELYMSRAGDIAFYRIDAVSGRGTPFATFASGTWEAAYEIDTEAAEPPR